MVLAANIPDLKAAAALVMLCLSHTACMWRGRGDRQSDWGKGAHEKQNEQHSGGQAVHNWFEALTRIKPDHKVTGCRGASPERVSDLPSRRLEKA